MKRIMLLNLCILASFGEINIIPATPENVDKFEQIIDVRIPAERRELGIIKDAKIIEFSKDKKKLWKEISSKIDTTKPFAIICRGGRRSTFVAELLDNPNLNITILKGGMKELISQGYVTSQCPE